MFHIYQCIYTEWKYKFINECCIQIKRNNAPTIIPDLQQVWKLRSKTYVLIYLYKNKKTVL